ncbi:B12-binding domain-containing radical SAM protein [Streptomyces tsukubensis]|uniref:B12-binding domain-containing radical SAM protein n=1 Tax=Streptomyces tsukubensis TaxID=83656 RepID=UPI0015C2D7DA|nr:radical SAM protein [Streptomyces tsukubensis]
MINVLIIWPPHVPSYFNAGHHTPMYSVAGHVRGLPHVQQVDVCEAGVLNMNWKAVGDLLYQGEYDVIAMMNDFDAIDGFARFTEYARALSPNTRLITFGRLSSMNPGFFRTYDLDAVVESGDYECGVASYLSARAEQPAEELPGGLPGVAVRTAEGWRGPSGTGAVLEPGAWTLPDVAEIPYAAYDRLYVRDEDKFCGIPFRRELVVPVARGCPIGCEFCEVPEIFGLRERRLSVDATVEYIERAYAAAPFEYVAFYAPTFTLNRRWVSELCGRFLAGPLSPRWKCATTVHHLDEELVGEMGAAGCVRVSVGLETLDEAGHEGLPRAKRIHRERFSRLAAWCDKAGVELNAFVIVGLPGTTVSGTKDTMAFARSLGARVRPTMYTPIHHLTADMSPGEVARYNRQLRTDPAPSPDDRDWHGFVFGPEDRPTTVYERVPRHAPQASR